MGTAKSDHLGISDALMQLVYEGLGRGLRLSESGEAFGALLLVETPESIAAVTLHADTVEHGILAGRRAIARGTDERHVLVYGGWLADDATGQDNVSAVHVEAYERSSGVGHRFAQRYLYQDAGSPVSPLGIPAYLHALPLPREGDGA